MSTPAKSSRGVFKRRFGTGSMIALTFVLVIAAATLTSAIRPLDVFATSTDTCGYNPNSAPAPNGGTVVFNENTVTRAISFYGIGLSGHIGVFAMDESSLYIGSSGTPFSPFPVRPTARRCLPRSGRMLTPAASAKSPLRSFSPTSPAVPARPAETGRTAVSQRTRESAVGLCDLWHVDECDSPTTRPSGTTTGTSAPMQTRSRRPTPSVGQRRRSTRATAPR